MLPLACVQLKKQLVKSSLTDVTMLCCGWRQGLNWARVILNGVPATSVKNVSRPPLAWGRAQCEIHHVLSKVRPSCQGTMPRSGV